MHAKAGWWEVVPRTGHVLLETVANLGTSTRFLFKTLAAVGQRHFQWRQLSRQIYSVGVLSLLLMLVAALFTGSLMAGSISSVTTAR